MIAALYVETGGVYFGLTDVDPWDEQRDARQYAGPWPVVAHPPCERWSTLAALNQALHGHQIGDDGGCFAAALDAVRTYGGVLEHPANSFAWSRFDLPTPIRHGWQQSIYDPGWATEVSQVAYGHPCRKRTWLYYVGECPPPSLDWSEPEATGTVGGGRWRGAANREGRTQYDAASRSPLSFRDELLCIAAWSSDPVPA